MPSPQHQLVWAAQQLCSELFLLCGHDGRLTTVAALSSTDPSLLTGPGVDSLLEALADYIVQPTYALTVARYFRAVLLEVCARATSRQYETHTLEPRTLAFARIVTVYPRVLPVVMQHLRETRDLFENVTVLKAQAHRLTSASSSSSTSSTSSTPATLQNSSLRLRQLAEAARRLLVAAPDQCTSLWNWSPVYDLVDAADPSTRHHARCAIALRSRCTERESQFCNHRAPSTSPSSSSSSSSSMTTTTTTTTQEDEGEALFVEEEALHSAARIEFERALSYVAPLPGPETASETALAPPSTATPQSMFSHSILPQAPLHPSLVNVCGVLLRRCRTTTTNTTHRYGPVQRLHDRLVETQTCRQNMALFAQAMCQCKRGNFPNILQNTLPTHFQHMSNTCPTHFQHMSNTFSTHF